MLEAGFVFIYIYIYIYICWTYLLLYSLTYKVFLVTGSREYFLMTRPQPGQQFWQEFHRAHLLFLVYKTKLHKTLGSVVNLFADDYIIRSSLFSKVHNPLLSAEMIKNDLNKISEWSHQWRIYFNPDPTKHAQEVIFKQKAKEIHHQTSYFNVAPVAHTNCQKNLGVHLDKNVLQYIKEKTLKANTDIIRIGKLRPLP